MYWSTSQPLKKIPVGQGNYLTQSEKEINRNTVTNNRTYLPNITMYLSSQRWSYLPFLFIFLSLSYVYTEDIDYQTAHELAVNAFEVLSPPATGGNKTTAYQYVANDIMDVAIEKVRWLISKENMDRIQIPDFTQTFERDFGVFKVDGYFQAKNGWVESLLSVSRRGDTIIHVDGTSLVLDAHLGLNTLDLGMKFQIEVLGIKPKEGDIRGHVRSNDVKLIVAMDFATGSCQLKVRALKIFHLGKIDVDVTGYGELNWLATQIASWVTDRAHARITEAVNDILNDLLVRELRKADCPLL